MAEGDYFQELYPNIWMITTCKSGFFKTTGLNKGSKIAQDFEADISEEILDLHEQRMKIDPNKKEEIKKNDNKIAELEIQSPILPNRSTAEGLIDLLARGQAGTIFLSETGEWLETMEKTYNSGLKALFTDLYDVPRQRTYRTRTGGTLIINRPFISICGVSTLTWVKENINPEDVSSGFFARFLLFYPPQEFVVPPALPAKGKIQDSSVEEEIKQILQDVKPDTVMELSDESEKAFIRVHESLYHNLEQMSEKNQEILGPYVKRWSPYILKIAMLNQLIIEPGSTVISLEALRGAITIIEYAMKSTTYLFENDLGESENQRKCRIVLEFIAKRNGQATRQAILSSKTLGGGAKDYDYILETLEESGKVLIEKKGQKKDWIYSLNSAC